MASDSSEDEPHAVRLPTELGEWLDRRAAELGVDRQAVLAQLVASYRAAADLDGDAPAGDDPFDVAGPDAVRDVVEPSIEEAAAAAVEEALDAPADGDQADLAELRSEFQAKVEDVRERVVQVKREADGKAPADHTHEAFERIDDVADRVGALEEGFESLEGDVADLAATVDDVGEGQGEAVDALEADLAEVRERLQTVAWVVSDLREAYESKGSTAALEQIRREAAAADLSRARCERCGEGVEIGLLTEPACPHCDATVTDVEPAGGFFGKPRLLVASQLEAGDGS